MQGAKLHIISTLKNNKYKLIVTLVFGFLGFIINLHAITIYEFNNINIDILFGLIFPLFISLVWGWKFGLICAVFGGTQTMWFLWYSDGYGLIYSVPVFTIWIFVHGLARDLRTKNNKWYYNKYIVELVFRLVCSLGFYTIFMYLVALNPPFWAPEINENYVSWGWVNLVVIKHIIEGFLLLFIVDILKKFKWVRKLFGLKEKPFSGGFTIVVSFLCATFVWIVDAIVQTTVFNCNDLTFFDNFLFSVKPHSFFMRIIIYICFLIFGLVLDKVVNRCLKNQKELERNRRQLNDTLKLATSLEKDQVKNEKEFLSKLLRTAIDIIPEADIGLTFVYSGEDVVFTDAIGFDLDFLNELKIKKLLKTDGTKDIIVITNARDFYLKNIDEGKREIFKRYIKEMNQAVVVVLCSDDIKVAGFSLGILKNKNLIFSDDSMFIVRALRNISCAFFSLIHEYKLKEEFSEEIIYSIIKILSMHDPYTEGHCSKVAKLSKLIAEAMGLTEEEKKNSYWTGMVHDIGKILISDDILNKKGLLTESEYEIVKKHPNWGYETLKDSKVLKNISKNVLHHHERWDGNGYPCGKTKDNIPLISRIIAVADSYDAMTSDRPYRKALSKEYAIKEIKRCSGTQFDPIVVDAFVSKVVTAYNTQ